MLQYFAVTVTCERLGCQSKLILYQQYATLSRFDPMVPQLPFAEGRFSSTRSSRRTDYTGHNRS
jgi:hypothetical protein